MIEDTFKTIATASQGIFKDRGSKFLAFAFPVKNEFELTNHLNDLRKEYYDARHHCYAWSLGAIREHYRVNDDGEPSSTGGKPIYGQMLSFEITNVLIVVVRYFGGTLLGVSGLINAYKTAAADAIKNAEIIVCTVNDVFELTFDYLVMNDVMKIIKDEKLEPQNTLFEMNCKLEISIRQSLTEKILNKLNKIDSLKINKLY